MYEKDTPKASFDFFKRKNIEITASSPAFLKMWAMMLYTIYRCFDFFAKVDKEKIIITVIGAVVILGAFWGVSYDDKQKAINQQVVQQKSNQKMELIKEIDETQFNQIISHIKATKEFNLKAIKTAYWSAMYINNEESEMSLERLNIDVRELADKTTRFYDKRAVQMTQAYSMIKKGKPELITADNSDFAIEDLILSWDNNTRVSNLILREEVTRETASWLKRLKNPVKMTEYLEKNKNIIENTKIF